MKLLHQGNHQLRLSNNRKLDFPLHLQNGIEIIYLRSGSTRVRCGVKEFPMGAGDLLAVFPNTVHGFTNSVDTDSLMLLIPAADTGPFRSLLERKEPTTPILHANMWLHSGLDRILEMAHKDWKESTEPVRQGYILLVLGKLVPLLNLAQRTVGNGDALVKALAYLHEHYTEPITRRQLASALGYHESYISHIFSESLHTTLTEYLLQLRLDEATELLQSTKLSISDIATGVGFGSIRSFNRVFAKAFDCTPKEYRSKLTN